jgi:hypothetical protein
METQTQTKAPMRPNKILKWLLILGIVIVLNLFFVYGIKVLYHEPTFDNFCPVNQVTQSPATQAECVAVGGGWTNYSTPVQYVPVQSTTEAVPAVTPQKTTSPIIATQPAGYCDVNFTCQKNFTTAESVYNRNVFVALVILGVLSLVAGFFISGSAAVSLGLSLGGVLALIVGSVRYWSDMNDYLRVAVLAVALVVLIAIGVKKVRD